MYLIIFSDAPLDSILKTHLICDILNVASIPLVREKNVQNQCAIIEDGKNEKKEDNLIENQEVKDQQYDDTVSTSSHVSSSVAVPSGSSIGDSGFCNCGAIDATGDGQVKRRPSSATGNYCSDSITNKQELFHSDSCSAFSTSSGNSLAANRKRKLLSTRASKVRKAQLSYKVFFKIKIS